MILNLNLLGNNFTHKHILVTIQLPLSLWSSTVTTSPLIIVPLTPAGPSSQNQECSITPTNLVYGLFICVSQAVWWWCISTWYELSVVDTFLHGTHLYTIIISPMELYFYTSVYGISLLRVALSVLSAIEALFVNVRISMWIYLLIIHNRLFAISLNIFIECLYIIIFVYMVHFLFTLLTSLLWA